MNSSSFVSPSFTPPNCRMPSRMSLGNSSCSGRRATPTTSNSAGKRPDCSRWKRAGSSLRLVKSPDAPKITTTVGSGIRSALCAAFKSSGENFTSVVAMELAPCSQCDALCPDADCQAQPLQRLHALCLILIANCVNSQSFRRLAVALAVVDKSHFLRIALQHVERQLEDFGIRLAQPQIAGTEENIEVQAQGEALDPIIVQFPGLVV